jgi:hypothetical protein
MIQLSFTLLASQCSVRVPASANVASRSDATGQRWFVRPASGPHAAGHRSASREGWQVHVRQRPAAATGPRRGPNRARQTRTLNRTRK